MTMQGRSFVSATGYRFGYQGSEKDKEINSGAYTTDFRGLDVRLGRWLSPDPIIHPSWSPYVSMNDNPIALVDPMGLEAEEGGGTGCGTEQGSTVGEFNPNGDKVADISGGQGGTGSDGGSNGGGNSGGSGATFPGGAITGALTGHGSTTKSAENAAPRTPGANKAKATANRAQSSNTSQRAKTQTNVTVDDNDIWDGFLAGAKAMWNWAFGDDKPAPVPEKLKPGKQIPSVLDNSNFISQVNPDIDPKKKWDKCFKTCKKIVEAAGGEVSDGAHGYYMSDDDGDVLPDAEAAIKKIDEILKSGKPVVVGVNYESGSPNNDKTTDHFVVIVGKGVDANGKVYYQFWDVGVYDNPDGHKKGTSEENRLYQEGNLLKGSRVGKKDKIYTGSWLRINK
jgi:RHS repeat-associated protein